MMKPIVAACGLSTGDYRFFPAPHGVGNSGAAPENPALRRGEFPYPTPLCILPKYPRHSGLRNSYHNIAARHGNCSTVVAEIGITFLPRLLATTFVKKTRLSTWFAPEPRLGCSAVTAGAHSRDGLPGPEREERPGPGSSRGSKGTRTRPQPDVRSLLTPPAGFLRADPTAACRHCDKITEKTLAPAIMGQETVC